MTLDAAEFIRRFLLHVLPSGFHRIRHYGLFASAVRVKNIERARQFFVARIQPPLGRIFALRVQHMTHIVQQCRRHQFRPAFRLRGKMRRLE